MTDIFFGGGINQHDNENMSPEECFSGQNFILDARERNFRPRAPCDLKGTLPNAGQVYGIMQMVKRDDTQTQIVVGHDKVYNWDGASVFSEVATVVTASRLRSTYWSLDDVLAVTDIDKNNVLQEWTGTAFQKHKHGIGNGTSKSVALLERSGATATATVTSHGYSNNDLITISGANETEYNGEFLISNVATDTFDYTVATTPATPATGTILAEKSVDLYAKYSFVFNNRLWLCNITTDSDANPHMLLASEFEDANVFDTAQTVTASGLTGNEAFFLLSPDLRPINGAAVFFNTVLLSTCDGKIFKLTGTDSSNYSIDEYYAGSGATGEEAIVNTGNDVVYVRKGGSVESLNATERFGDVDADDVSQWIDDEEGSLSSPLTVYDQQRQRVYFFVTDKVLVLDKEMMALRPELSPWSIFKTGMTNNFNTTAATYMRVPGSTTYNTYWGDSIGRMFIMSGTRGEGDAGSIAVQTIRQSKIIESFKHTNITGRLEYRRKDQVVANLEFDWAEEYQQASCAPTLKAEFAAIGPASYFGGDVYFGGEFYFSDGTTNLQRSKISSVGFSPVGKGPGFFLEIKIDDTGDWLINKLRI